MPDSPPTRHALSKHAARSSVGAALEAGLLAGAAFLLLEYLSTVVLGAESPLGPARITLRSVLNLGPGGATEPHVLTVLVLHFGLALLTTLGLSALVHRMVLLWALTFGVVYGLFLYAVNFFLFAFWLPDITAARDLPMFVNYMIYGALAARVYKWRQPERVG